MNLTKRFWSSILRIPLAVAFITGIALATKEETPT